MLNGRKNSLEFPPTSSVVRKPAFGGLQTPIISDDTNWMEISLGQSSEAQRQEFLQDSRDKEMRQTTLQTDSRIIKHLPASKRKFLLDVKVYCIP
jgi:hypothetical protein